MSCIYVCRNHNMHNVLSLYVLSLCEISFLQASFYILCTVMILSFQTDRPGQTVQTQIRLLLESLIRVYIVCHSVCIVWTYYSMVEPNSSKFRVIKTNFWGVRIFRKFTVPIVSANDSEYIKVI